MLKVTEVKVRVRVDRSPEILGRTGLCLPLGQKMVGFFYALYSFELEIHHHG